MGVKWKTTTNRLDEVSKNVELLGGKKVEVGCNWANAWL